MSSQRTPEEQMRRWRAAAFGALTLAVVAIAAWVATSSDESPAPNDSPPARAGEAQISPPLDRQGTREQMIQRSVPLAFWMGEPPPGGQVRADLSQDPESSPGFLALAYLRPANVRELERNPLSFHVLLTSNVVADEERKEINRRLRDQGAEYVRLQDGGRAALVVGGAGDEQSVQQIVLLGTENLVGEMLINESRVTRAAAVRELKQISEISSGAAGAAG